MKFNGLNLSNWVDLSIARLGSNRNDSRQSFLTKFSPLTLAPVPCTTVAISVFRSAGWARSAQIYSFFFSLFFLHSSFLLTAFLFSWNISKVVFTYDQLCLLTTSSPESCWNSIALVAPFSSLRTPFSLANDLDSLHLKVKTRL